MNQGADDQVRSGDERKDEGLPYPGGQPPCQCYCIKQWLAPLPAPDVPLPGFPKVYTDWVRRTQIEVEEGEVFWTADVTQKTYNCTTKVVLGQQVLQGMNLAKEKYVQYRTRGLVVTTGTFLGIPYPTSITWGTWSAPLRATGLMAERDSLASPAPPLTPWCPDDGVNCP